jgi:hypothetical protein
VAIATPPAAGPIDTSIVAVSASNPTAPAKQALDACSAYDIGLDHVVGMGLVAQAKDVGLYIPLGATPLAAPMTDPVWVIKFHGTVPEPKAGVGWVDPCCVVANGLPQFLAYGPEIDLSTGSVIRNYYWGGAAARSLPPLAP